MLLRILAAAKREESAHCHASGHGLSGMPGPLTGLLMTSHSRLGARGLNRCGQPYRVRRDSERRGLPINLHMGRVCRLQS